jgi:hypothetical protein
VVSLFVWIISHQPAVLFSQNKPATGNEPTVLFSQNKSTSAISHPRARSTLPFHLFLCLSKSIRHFELVLVVIFGIRSPVVVAKEAFGGAPSQQLGARLLPTISYIFLKKT